MVEVGIPFSDPMADGPVIQEAATQALRNGMSLHLLFEQLKEIRSEVQIPIILMGYLNPIMQYGFEKFCATTGAQQDFNEQKQAYFRRINAMNLQNPRLVGFGISNKATFEAATAHSSGAIIGSKFVQLLKSEATPAEAVDKLLEALKQ